MTTATTVPDPEPTAAPRAVDDNRVRHGGGRRTGGPWRRPRCTGRRACRHRGESGSGKSALALSILGLIDPPGRIVSGSVFLGMRNWGCRTSGALRRVRGKRIALVFQDPMTALDPLQTIGRQLAESLRTHSR